MAKVEVVLPPPVSRTYVLTLSEQEAMELFTLVYGVLPVGHPVVEALVLPLRQAGVPIRPSATTYERDGKRRKLVVSSAEV